MVAAASAAKVKQTSGPEWAVTEFWLEKVRELVLEPSGNGDQPDRMLKASEVADRLRISTRTVYASAKGWPFAKRYPAGSIRFSEKGLDRWLSRR